MAPPLRVDSPAMLFKVAPEFIEALERLRDSYPGLLAREALMELDQAVLMVVQLTLKNAHTL